MDLGQGLRKLFAGIAGNSRQTVVDRAIYAVGDIHGYDDALEPMLLAVKKDIKARQRINPNYKAEIVFTGDYVCRGPNSKRVIDLLSKEIVLQEDDGIRRTFLAGNHDYLLLQLLESKMPSITTEIARDMLDYGGLQTAASYGVYLKNNTDARNTKKIKGVSLCLNQSDLLDFQERMQGAVPEHHVSFLKNMKTSYHTEEFPEFFFCHAGVDWTKPYTEQKTNILIGMGSSIDQKTSRDFARYTDGAKDIIVVHGHTIKDKIECRSGRISIDTGVFEKGGRLSCSILADGQMIDSIQIKPKASAYNPKYLPEPKITSIMSQPLDVRPQ
ncbi:MAG: hypothetical protein AUJ12_03630 [Alphaproteobacteria bacterium CG1_02_46_17]|nr:MAG: hypothetical protein AUJ12_03630 [Alphaproteobacteria bacterium CG1_02_46_17]